MPGLHRLDKVGYSPQKASCFEDVSKTFGRISDLCCGGSVRCDEGCGNGGAAMRTPSDWLDNHSHSFEPSEPASKETDSAVEIPQADDAPQPGTLSYLSLGCDHLWIDIGGECG